MTFAIIVLAFSLCFRTCQVSGESMENTLFDKETVVISNMFYTPKRGDIIVFHQTGDKYNEPIVKRVIGLPGDKISIRYEATTMYITIEDSTGKVEVLQEEYIKYDPPVIYSNTREPIEVKEGTIFVMGDNRNRSADSRDRNIGLVDTRRVLGKVMFRVTPIQKFGAVK